MTEVLWTTIWLNTKDEKRKRWLIGVLTVICCILIVILIVTYESAHGNKTFSNCSSKLVEKTTTSNNVTKFIHLSDSHYDPFYDKTISNSFFCRQQRANSITANYIAQYGRIGCDSPAILLENSLGAITNVTREEEIKLHVFISVTTGKRKLKCQTFSLIKDSTFKSRLRVSRNVLFKGKKALCYCTGFEALEILNCFQRGALLGSVSQAA